MQQNRLIRNVISRAADRFKPLKAAPKAVLASVDTLENVQNGARPTLLQRLSAWA